MDKKDVVYIHDGILLSHKKEWNNAICINMDGPRDDHTKWSKSDKDKYHMILLICGILKNDTNELIYKQNRNRPTDITNLWLPKGKGVERNKLGVWD